MGEPFASFMSLFGSSSASDASIAFFNCKQSSLFSQGSLFSNETSPVTSIKASYFSLEYMPRYSVSMTSSHHKGQLIMLLYLS